VQHKATPSPRHTACETCRFFRTTEHPKQDGQMQLGECRRQSPQWLAGSSKALFLSYACVSGQEDESAVDYDEAQTAVWPLVREWDWCGEHQLRKDAL
jgi:hypothetical protein